MLFYRCHIRNADPNELLILPAGRQSADPQVWLARPWRSWGETVWAYQTEADPTGISDVNIEPTTDNRYFDLQGRNIAPSDMKRGIYIINGKKVIVNNR